jgi:hypothetical protein
LSEEDNKAGWLNEAEEVVEMIIPSGQGCNLPLDPGEKAFDQLVACNGLAVVFTAIGMARCEFGRKRCTVTGRTSLRVILRGLTTLFRLFKMFRTPEQQRGAGLSSRMP